MTHQEHTYHQEKETKNPPSNLKSVFVSTIKLTDRFWASRLQNLSGSPAKPQKKGAMVAQIDNACQSEQAYKRISVQDEELIASGNFIPSSHDKTNLNSSIKALKWSWYKLQTAAQCQYADYMEFLLYNAFLPGISLDGHSYTNTNTYISEGSHFQKTRFDKDGLSPDLVTTLGSMPGYIYSTSKDTIWIHQYAANEATLTLPDGEKVSILQRTRYPWDGNVIIEILDECALSLKVRIPGWCQNNVEININGDLYTHSVTSGTYVTISRSWSVGDSVCIQFPLTVRQVRKHTDATEDIQQVALMRGPILYCIESQDQPNIDLFHIVLPSNQTLTSTFQPKFLNGIQTIEVPVIEGPNSDHTTTSMIAIPYYAWGNRGPGQMLVWLQESGKNFQSNG